MLNVKNKVAILMSTYNGEKFIEEQLNSILCQEKVKVSIYIRDDGSTDNTVRIIQQFIKKKHEIYLEEGTNLGFANSFYSLVTKDREADYYAFSDQDDIWEKSKLITAINRLGEEEATLYGSNLRLLDTLEQRRNLLLTLDEENIKKYKMYFFILNPYGCTMVWNKEMHKNLLKHKKPDKMTHDTWVNLVANCTGQLILDPDTHINYRIHENNTCGAPPKKKINKLKKYVKRYFIEKKSLQISLSCMYINSTFPKKSNSTVDALASYNKGVKSYMKSFFYIIFKTNIPEKKKMALLMLINKL